MIYWKDVDFRGFFSGIPSVKYGRTKYIGKRKGSYKDMITTFDVESTTLSDDMAIVYLWSWFFPGIGSVYGRSIDEFRKCAFRVNQAINGDSLVVYVHNLKFEYCFLSEWLENVFIVRKSVLSAELGGLKFRDSYSLVLLKLEDFLRQMGVEHQKLDLDYSVERLPDTNLSDAELVYSSNDVQGLHEAILKYSDIIGYDPVHLPLTASGIIRDKIGSLKKSMGIEYPAASSYESYLDFSEALRGGYILRMRTGQVYEDVHCIDIKSSYPAIIYNEDFPAYLYKAYNKSRSNYEFYNREGYCTLSLIKILRMDPKHCDSIPYMGIDKGSECWVTDLDFEILNSEYDLSYTIIRYYYGQYMPLPDNIKKVTKDLFIEKESSQKDSPEYFAAKIRLNSIAGAMQTRSHNYITGECSEFDYIRDKHTASWMPIFWGIWVTAWGRYMMYKAIQETRKHLSFPIYGDTDSIYYVGDKIRLSSFNRGKKKSLSHDGKIAGYWYEDKNADKMIISSSKHYCYESDGKIHIKIAGGSGDMNEFLKIEGIEAFVDGVEYTVPVCRQIWKDHERVYKGHRITKGCAVFVNEKRILGGNL